MFDFHSIYNARSVSDALSALDAKPDAQIIAGGTDVLIKLREQLHEQKRHTDPPDVDIVSIHDVPELRGIDLVGGDIVIKPCTTFAEINENPIVREHIPILAHAVDQVGGPQIRHMGTIGGNISNGVTSADSAPSLFVLNAMLELRSSRGVRIMPIQQFYLSAGKVALQKGEILTAIIIEQSQYINTGGHYIKYAMREAMDIATLSCAVLCRLSDDKRVLEDVRISYGVAAPVPIRCPKTEAQLKGLSMPDAIDVMTENVVTEVNPRTSWRASREFRLQLVKELGVRAFKEAVRQAGGEAL